MRGKDDEGRLKLRHVGITPAYAGKSALQLCTDSCSRDHPRVCGEKRLMVVMEYAAVGSPPRMRGKVQAPVQYPGRSGITPAYAGKSGNCHVHVKQDWDPPTPAYAGKSSGAAR